MRDDPDWFTGSPRVRDNNPACLEYFDGGFKLPKGLADQVRQAMSQLEKSMKLGFGDSEKPLLVSIRSGAAISMPGMMDTVLNLGLERRDRSRTNQEKRR